MSKFVYMMRLLKLESTGESHDVLGVNRMLDGLEPRHIVAIQQVQRRIAKRIVRVVQISGETLSLLDCESLNPV